MKNPLLDDNDPRFFKPAQKEEYKKQPTFAGQLNSYCQEYSFPPLKWLPKYNFSKLQGDLIAGLVVGSMLIPQGLAYSQLAGLPPIYGLYANLGSAVGYTLFGTSNQIMYGPVALPSILTRVAIDSLGVPKDTPYYINCAYTLCILNGLVMFILGLLRAGKLASFLSGVVRSAFITASGTIIFFSQLKKFFGITSPKIDSENFLVKEGSVLMHIDSTNWETLVLASFCMIVLLLLKRYKQKIPKWIPGALILMILTIVLSYALNFKKYGIKILGDIPKGLPTFVNPLKFKNLSPDGSVGVLDLIIPAIEIAVISYIGAWALALKFADQHGYVVYPNQELIAQGIGNIASSPFQSQPVTASFSRSAVNNDMGAKTPLANLVVVTLIILTLEFLTPVFFYLPECVLAAIVMVSVKSLIDVAEVKYLWKVNKIEFCVWWITFGLTVGLGIQQGIIIGIVVSLLLSVYESSRSYMTITAPLISPHSPRDSPFVDVRRYNTNSRGISSMVVVRFDGPIFFANASRFRDSILKIVGKNNDKNIEEKHDKTKDIQNRIPKSASVPFNSKSPKPGLKKRSRVSSEDISEVQSMSNYSRERVFSFTRDSASAPSTLILDCSAIVRIDCTSLRIFSDMLDELDAADPQIQFVMAGILPAVYDTLSKANIIDRLKPNQLFFSVQDAFHYYQESVGINR